MTSERRASSLARPPALRITWASPSRSPASLEGRILASMHVRMANLRAGGIVSFALSPNVDAYSAFALRTSSRTLLIIAPRFVRLAIDVPFERHSQVSSPGHRGADAGSIAGDLAVAHPP